MVMTEKVMVKGMDRDKGRDRDREVKELPIQRRRVKLRVITYPLM